MMMTQQTQTAHYNPIKLRKQARHKTENLPLLEACEFCGDTENLQHCHFDYKNYPEHYVTGCKLCNEWNDINPNTKQLAYKIKLAKMWRYINKHKKAGYVIEHVEDRGKYYCRIIEPSTKIIKEVVNKPTY